MSRRSLFFLIVFAAGLAAGRWLSEAGPQGSWLGPPAAHAGTEGMPLGDGAVFVTSDGPNAFLWRRAGDRLQLLGQCSRTAEGTAQATFVWMPGVERES